MNDEPREEYNIDDTKEVIDRIPGPKDRDMLEHWLRVARFGLYAVQTAVMTLNENAYIDKDACRRMIDDLIRAYDRHVGGPVVM